MFPFVSAYHVLRKYVYSEIYYTKALFSGINKGQNPVSAVAIAYIVCIHT